MVRMHLIQMFHQPLFIPPILGGVRIYDLMKGPILSGQFWESQGHNISRCLLGLPALFA